VPEKTVTVRQFLEAQEILTEGWEADDPRWEALCLMLDYSVQYGEFKAVVEVF
jgi:hypothetical protein